MAKKYPPTFGDRLREMRARKGLSQQALADMVAVNRVTVANLERNARSNPSWATVQRLVRALECGYSDLETMPGK